MKTIGALLICFAIANIAVCQTTADPLSYFKGRWDLTGVTKIYKLEADINNDGLNDFFLAVNKSDPPQGDEVGWELYIAKPNGQYVLAGEKTDTGINQNTGVTFDKTQYWIGLIPEINRYGLLHLTCGTGGMALCQLKAIVIEGDGWKEIPIGTAVNAEQNYDKLAKRFQQNPVPSVQELNP